MQTSRRLKTSLIAMTHDTESATRFCYTGLRYHIEHCSRRRIYILVPEKNRFQIARHMLQKASASFLEPDYGARFCIMCHGRKAPTASRSLALKNQLAYRYNPII